MFQYSLGAELAAAETQGLPRQELADFLEDAQGGRDVVEGQVEPEGLPVDPLLDGGVLQDRLDFRGEEEGAAVMPPDEGLDADSVAAQDERVHPLVPDGKGKHAGEPARALDPLLLVEVDDDLAVRVRAETVAAVFQLLAKLRVVVDLSVENEPDRPVLVGHGLAARLGEIDDGESTVPEPDGDARAVLEVDAGPVGSPVGHDAGHAPQGRFVEPAAVCRYRSTDSAHGRYTASSCNREGIAHGASPAGR